MKTTKTGSSKAGWSNWEHFEMPTTREPDLTLTAAEIDECGAWVNGDEAYNPNTVAEIDQADCAVEVRKADAALKRFIRTVEAVGGLERVDGELRPVGDPEWLDLADAYVAACAVIGKAPVIAE